MPPIFSQRPILSQRHTAVLSMTALSLFCLPAIVCAATRNVPASYSTVQGAVNAASSGDTVLIADGTYSGPGNRDIDFGGKSLTVTSQHGASVTTLDCGGFASDDGSGNHRGFYIHSGEDSVSISGLTIKNGYEAFHSNISDSDYGSGMFLENTGGGTIAVSNCVVTEGSGGSYGGGIYNYNAGSGGAITVTGCTLSHNRSEFNGGAVYNYNVSNGNTITLTSCTLTDNSTDIGGVFNFNDSGGTIVLSRCTLTNNTADFNAAGIFNDLNSGGSIAITNCALSGNTAGGGSAGAISNDVNSGGAVTITNCTLTQNSAGSGGVVGGVYNENDSGSSTAIKLINTIVYGNTGGDVVNSSGSSFNAIIQFSDIGGGYSGTGNLNSDPKFVSTPTNLHLQPSSPCLGKGTASGAPTITLDGFARPNPPSIGAFELMPSAVPGAPTNLTATASGGKVNLAWTAPSGTVTSYSLYRGTASGGETLYKSGFTGTTFVNATVTLGTKYYYYVKAVNSAGTGPASNEASATPTGSAVPGAPTNLQAVPGDTKVTLTWTAPSGSVTSYTLYRGASASSLTVYKAGFTGAMFVNSVVTNGTTYFYAVAATNDAGTGPKSGTVSATPLALPGAPAHLTASVSSGKVNLAWGAASGTVASYSVYRGTSSGGETFYKSAGTATTFVNATVTHGTKYYYTVKAVNSTGTGAPSNEANATP